MSKSCANDSAAVAASAEVMALAQSLRARDHREELPQNLPADAKGFPRCRELLERLARRVAIRRARRNGVDENIRVDEHQRPSLP